MKKSFLILVRMDAGAKFLFLIALQLDQSSSNLFIKLLIKVERNTCEKRLILYDMRHSGRILHLDIQR